MTRKILKTALSSTAMMIGALVMTSPSFAGEAAQTEKMAMKDASMMKSETASVNAPYNDFLAKYVERQNGINLVAYDKVTDADEAKLEAYIDTLSNTDISGFSDAEIMAYWFNLYNAKTVDVILDNYPVSSIRKIGFTGPWGKKLLTVNGEKLSLNNIEHDIVREDYDEPRVHFAFNCASIGCPDLKLTAWEAETLEEDLTQASIDFVASPRGITVDQDGDITASSIFKWYRKDFGKNEAELAQYLSQFATGAKKTALENATKIDDYDYDWSLNITGG